jgi:D-sedoheptulose 7-phosphate isomerase
MMDEGVEYGKRKIGDKMSPETIDKLSATSYLQDLGRVLLSTSATDSKGTEMFLDAAAEKAIDMYLSHRNSHTKVLLVGNGGSAAIVSHAQNDLCKMLGIKALTFHETSLLTALSNDISYEAAYEWPTQLWAQKGDLLIAVSSSGQSRNILRAVRAAAERGCQVITFSGFKPNNPLRSLGDLNFYVAAKEYGQVEVAHMALNHLLTDLAAAQIKSTEAPRS